VGGVHGRALHLWCCVPWHCQGRRRGPRRAGTSRERRGTREARQPPGRRRSPGPREGWERAASAGGVLAGARGLHRDGEAPGSPPRGWHTQARFPRPPARQPRATAGPSPESTPSHDGGGSAPPRLVTALGRLWRERPQGFEAVGPSRSPPPVPCEDGGLGWGLRGPRQSDEGTAQAAGSTT
jgi:hypothetical protein